MSMRRSRLGLLLEALKLLFEVTASSFSLWYYDTWPSIFSLILFFALLAYMQLATKTKVIAAKKVSVSFLKDREKNPGAKCLFFVESILGPNLFLEDDEKGIAVRRIQLRTL